MTRDVKLNQLAAELDTLSYPATHDDVATAFDDVVLLYADGEEAFVEVLDRSAEDVFVSSDALEAEIFNNLPTEAVGEPGQSEGEG